MTDESTTAESDRSKDLLVIAARRPWTCADCGAERDRLLMSGISRFDAREPVRPQIDGVLDRWGRS